MPSMAPLFRRALSTFGHAPMARKSRQRPRDAGDPADLGRGEGVVALDPVLAQHEPQGLAEGAAYGEENTRHEAEEGRAPLGAPARSGGRGRSRRGSPPSRRRSGSSVSPVMILLNRVVKRGTRVMISMEMREPTTTKARKRKRSPTTKPTNPEIDSQTHRAPERRREGEASREHAVDAEEREGDGEADQVDRERAHLLPGALEADGAPPSSIRR